LVHRNRDPFPLHHGRDSDPAFLFERIDGRRTLAGGDGAGSIEFGALNVVGAEDIFLGGCLEG
jgi:hypothetical protein